MPRNLITGFKKVATAGPTADGREIQEQDLLDMAETYNADTMLAACIWPEHYRFMSLGIVKEIKAERDEMGRMSLYARLAPNDYALSYNKQQQMLFTSIEITPNFAKTGKAYLTGLALTDSPASLGTQELRFSKIKNDSDSFFTEPAPFDFEDTHHASGTDAEPAMDGFFNRLRAFFKSEQFNQTTPHQDDNDMKPEQLDKLLAALDAQTEAFNQLAAKLQPESETDSDEGASDQEHDTEAFASLKTELTTLASSVSELKDQFAQLLEDKPGTSVPAGQGAVDDPQDADLV